MRYLYAVILNPDYTIEKLIPYRLGAINSLTHALRLRDAFGSPKTIEIYFDRKLTIVGNSNAYTNPVIESGLVHCRALLEFLGLCYTKNGLGNIVKRKGEVNSHCNRTTFSLPEDFMRCPVAEAFAWPMIQFFHGGCKGFPGHGSKVRASREVSS